MLLNLKHVYLTSGDFERALGVVERLLLVSPDDPRELRDRGFLLAHLGRPSAAIADLESYLTRNPAAPDADSIQTRLAWLRRRASQVH
jgi:regulator of sirC expression with transglutaminase-like and TPR domain